MLTVRIATLPLLEQRDLNLSDRIRYKQIYCVDGPPPPLFQAYTYLYMYRHLL